MVTGPPSSRTRRDRPAQGESRSGRPWRARPPAGSAPGSTPATSQRRARLRRAGAHRSDAGGARRVSHQLRTGRLTGPWAARRYVCSGIGISPVMARRIGYPAARLEQARVARLRRCRNSGPPGRSTRPSPSGLPALRSITVACRSSPLRTRGLKRAASSASPRARFLRSCRRRGSFPRAIVEAGPLAAGGWGLESDAAQPRLDVPLVIEPDVGQRGTGVQVASRRGRGRSLSGARATARAPADPASGAV